MKIAMIGTGYVGLVSGVCLSDFGHNVICVDKDPRKVEMLTRGEVPIYEPGLDVLMAKNVAAGRLEFTGDLRAAVDGADAVFIAGWALIDIGLSLNYCFCIRFATGVAALAALCLRQNGVNLFYQ